MCSSDLTPPRPRSITPPTQTHIPYYTGHNLLEVSRIDIPSGRSPTSSTEAILKEEDPRTPKEGITFFTSTGEYIPVEELEIPSEEEEEDNLFNIPLIEEPVEKLALQTEPYISSEESIMAEEGEGEVFNGEHTLFGGGRGRGGDRGRHIGT